MQSKAIILMLSYNKVKYKPSFGANQVGVLKERFKKPHQGFEVVLMGTTSLQTETRDCSLNHTTF